MSAVLGDKHRFAVEVGERGQLCRVDLWAAGVWLTCDDNMAYTPQFRRAVLHTADRLRSGEGSPPPYAGTSPEATHRRLGTETDHELRSRFRALDWGPTTDNVMAHLFREGEHLMITLEFWREEHLLAHPEHAREVFVVEIPTAEFIGILDDLVSVLDGSRKPEAGLS
ncbi:hypothetical protein [Streptomyces sp. NPDC004284]|uniref:hypothetical protein n=1 Tax=Streptomyces sp. NPDC004284 TaxID=3364695 RepID=UPI00368A3C94